MEVSEWLSILSLLIALVSICVAVYATRQARKLQANQWSRSELELRRDVLRRILGYRYRLTDGLTGTDGEPFVALNEASVVFAGFPEVIRALKQMHGELGQAGRFYPNFAALIRAMAVAAEISTEDLKDDFIDYPFKPLSARS